MKTEQIIYYLLFLFIGFIIGSLSMKFDIEDRKPKVDLPEEYKEITYQDRLQGYFDKDSVLHIEFDNEINNINNSY